MTDPAQAAENKASPLTALRVRDFRVYWIGLVAQIGGQQMFSFTLGWLVYTMFRGLTAETKPHFVRC